MCIEGRRALTENIFKTIGEEFYLSRRDIYHTMFNTKPIHVSAGKTT